MQTWENTEAIQAKHVTPNCNSPAGSSEPTASRIQDH
uniref:Uncharacterized protein n=1 Tax=Anguilla anguilla TaxID=7936 RepID=A0A0E9V1F1_ANGAN